jgi:hypothetical protein
MGRVTCPVARVIILALAYATEAHSRTRTSEFEAAWEATTDGASDEALANNSLLAGFHAYFAYDYHDNLNAARAGYEALAERNDEVAAKALRAELVPWPLGISDPVRERAEPREAAGE